MENILLFFFSNIHIVFFAIFILSFFIPLTIKIARNKKDDKILNKYNIFLDSGISQRVAAIFVMIIFSAIGLIIMYLSSREYDIDKNKSIGGMVCSLIFIVPPIIFIINTIKESIKILTGKYVIVVDELMDKYYYNDPHPADTDHSCWWLYFKDYFKKYNAKVKIESSRRGNSAKEGDKFYLVFVKGSKSPYIYECKKYILEESEKDKLKTIDEAKNYINKKELVLEKIIQNEKIIINKSTIKKDFTKAGHRKAAIIDVLICIFSILFLTMTILVFKNIVASILLLLVTVFWIIMTPIKIKYVYTIYSNINKGNFKIKEDEVISLNNRIQYSDSNQVISFKFKNYKKLVYEDKRVYHDTQIGDKFYLVFVKGEKDPIKVYNSKNSIVGEE